MSEWTDRAAGYMKSTLEELLKKYPEQQKRIEEAAKQYNWKSSSMILQVTEDAKYGGRYAINFRVGNAYTTMVKFTLECYPECCALTQLNGFYTCDEFLLEPFLKDFIQACLDVYRNTISQPRRLMINFVEWTRQDVYKPSQKKIPVSDKTQITYPMMYKWVKSFDNIETTFVNHNTGRIIHNVIVNLE